MRIDDSVPSGDACTKCESIDTAPAVRAIIAPSVLAADFSKLGSECHKVIKGGAEWIHLDIMDGHFVPNLSFGFPVVKSLSVYLDSLLASNGDSGCLQHGVVRVIKDVHIMVTDPIQWVQALQDCGADHVSFHMEACPSVDYAVHCAQHFKSRGMTVGIAVKPKTDVTECLEMIKENEGLFSLLLIMSVEPGFGGQKFDPTVLSKCQQARTMFPYLNIQLDGGMNAETTVLGAQAGANVIVAGTSVFAAADPAEAIQASLSQSQSVVAEPDIKKSKLEEVPEEIIPTIVQESQKIEQLVDSQLVDSIQEVDDSPTDIQTDDIQEAEDTQEDVTAPVDDVEDCEVVEVAAVINEAVVVKEPECTNGIPAEVHMEGSIPEETTGAESTETL